MDAKDFGDEPWTTEDDILLAVRFGVVMARDGELLEINYTGQRVNGLSDLYRAAEQGSYFVRRLLDEASRRLLRR